MSDNTSYCKFALCLFLVFASCQAPNPETSPDNASKSNPTTAYHTKGIAPPKSYKDSVGEQLRIISWNVEHFVDGHDSPYINNSREDNPPENRLVREQMLTEALKIANADVVVLQEFESAQYLKYLAETYLQDMGYTFFADHESVDWYMNVVVMSKVPLGILYGYGNAVTPATYTNEKGEVQYETQNMLNTRLWSVDVLVNDNYSFVLTGVHLKAGRGPRNEAIRLGQIAFLKGQFERFLHERPQTNLLFVGDMNSTPGSEEYRYILEEGKAKFIDPLDTAIYSHPADSPFWRLDYVLPNTNMAPELINGSAVVANFFSPDSMRLISDHLPLMADFYTSDRE